MVGGGGGGGWWWGWWWWWWGVGVHKRGCSVVGVDSLGGEGTWEWEEF